jgi:hypothetical protein
MFRNEHGHFVTIGEECEFDSSRKAYARSAQQMLRQSLMLRNDFDHFASFPLREWPPLRLGGLHHHYVRV